MSDGKLSSAEICEAATRLIDPLMKLCSQRDDNVHVGYVALCLAARAVRRMGIDSFGPAFEEEIVRLDRLVAGAAAYADAMAAGKGVTSPGGES